MKKQEKEQVELLVATGSSFLTEIQNNAALRRAVIKHSPGLVRRLKTVGIVVSRDGLKPAEPKKGLLVPIDNQA